MSAIQCHNCSYIGICPKEDDSGCNQWSASLEYIDKLEKRYETARDLLDTASVVLHVYSHGSALSKQIREFLDK